MNGQDPQNMKEMPESIDRLVRALKKDADNLQMKGKNKLAIGKYNEAISILPDPVDQWKYIRILWGSIADIYVVMNDYQAALEYFRQIMKLPLSVGDYDYHARIGLIHYEMGSMEKAKDELMRAYLLKGEDAFKYMGDAKYFELIKPIVEDKEKAKHYSINPDNYEI